MMIYLILLLSVNPIKTLKGNGFDYYKTSLDNECVRIVFIGEDLFDYFNSNGYTYSRQKLWAGTEEETLQYIVDEKLEVEKIKNEETKKKVKEKLNIKKEKLKVRR